MQTRELSVVAVGQFEHLGMEADGNTHMFQRRRRHVRTKRDVFRNRRRKDDGLLRQIPASKKKVKKRSEHEPKEQAEQHDTFVFSRFLWGGEYMLEGI